MDETHDGRVAATDNLPMLRWRLYWLAVIVGMALIGLFTYWVQTTERIRTVNSLLLNGVKEVRLQASNAHLWIEEALDGHIPSLGIEEIWRRIDEALAFIAEEEEAASREVADAIHRAVETFKAIDPHQAARLKTPEEIEAFSQHHDRVDHQLRARLDAIEGVIRKKIDHDKFKIQTVQVAIVCVLVITTCFLSVAVRRYQRRIGATHQALREINNRLQEEIDNRIRMTESLRQRETLFRTVFQANPHAVTLNRVSDGVFEDVNEGFLRLIGYRREEVIGRLAIGETIWGNSNDRDDFFNRLKTSGLVQDMEVSLQKRGGKVFQGLISANPLRLDGEAHFVALFRDISEIKAVQQFLKIANEHSSMQAMLDGFLAEVKTISGADAAGIRVLDEEGNIPYAAHEGFSKQFYELENRLSVTRHPSMCTAVISNSRHIGADRFTREGAFCTNDCEEFYDSLAGADSSRVRGQCRFQGFKSLALIPIRLGEQTLGLIHVAGRRKNMFSSDTIGILEQAAMSLGTAIQRVRAEEELKQSHLELEQRVKTRTQEFLLANRQLEQEIDERRRTELELLEYEAQLRSMSSELLLTGERERHRIATEIHDRIGQTLAFSRIKLGALKASTRDEPMSQAVEDIRKLVEQSIQDTRTLTFELSPPMLYELGLEATLEWAAEQIQQQSGIRITIKNDQQAKPLENSHRVFLYRAVRELLHNVTKHAAAESAQVCIARSGDRIRIEVVDDGAGFDPQAAPADRTRKLGFGLFSIREQVRHFGGSLKISSAPGQGTRATLELGLNVAPCKEAGADP